MATPLAFGYAANAVLGTFLASLGLLIATRSPERTTRGPLGLFLLLVGANYLLDGVANAMGDQPLRNPLRYASLLTGLLDPPTLLLFALVAWGGPLRRRTAFLIAAPSLVLVALFFVYPPRAADLANWPLRYAQIAQLALYYPLAFGLVAARYLHERSAVLRDRYALLTLALGVVVVPRVPLLLVDVGFVRGLSVLPAWGTLLLVGTLVALAAPTLVALARLGRARDRPDVPPTTRALALLLGAVGAVWLAGLVPSFAAASFSLVYASRWLLFAPLVVVGARRFDLFGLSQRAHRLVGDALVALALLVAGAILASVTASLTGDTRAALTVGATVALLAGGAVLALRRALPASDERAWSARSVYRAHVEAAADEVERDRLRRELGLSPRAAAEIEATAVHERRARARDARPLETGDLVGERYQVGEPLGAGAWGRVFSGHDRARGDEVVLKELLLAWRGDPDALEAYRREAVALCLVDHPAVVKLRSIEAVAGGYVLALDRVGGETLEERLARGPLGVDEARRVADDLLSGLHALHAAGLVHRDVKPANVMLRPDGGAVILDLGAAQGARGTRAAGGPHPRTEGFASPEQVAGARVGPTSDLYSAALVLWVALSGRAFPEGSVPEAWAPVLSRALLRDPEARWRDAGAMRDALAEAWQGARVT